MAQAMREFVTGLDQKSHGVDVHLGKGVERDKIDQLAVKCAPGGPGCNSDCCDPAFSALIEGIDVSGLGEAVTMHRRGDRKDGKVRLLQRALNEPPGPNCRLPGIARERPKQG